MSSGGSLEDRQKKLELAIKGIKKEHGEGAVGKYSDMPKIDVEVVSSGSLTLDHALGVGGLPRGRIVEVYGPECVDADTFVRYEVRRPDGTRQNHKGGTIERLYHRFHGIPMGGRGSYQRPQTVGSVFYAPSINEEGRVFQNRIVDVVRSGEKECYELQLRGGTSIIATAEHRFFTGTRYVSLGYLSAGDTVYIHNPSNLEIVTPEEHGRLHAAERQDKLRFVAVPDEVVSIVPVGLRETYDLCMAAPAHNYVANGMVVHNSSGKTTLTLHALAECQKEGGLAAFIDAEHALDPIYAENLGVDMDNLVLSQPDNGEQALNIVEDLCSSGALDIIVVDSVAALVPKAEIDGEMGDMQVGLQARLMSKACRKLSGIVSKTKTILVFINQTRSKIGVLFGSSDTTSGGNALKFYASQRIDIRRIGTVKKGEDSTASRTKCKVVKNKVAPPFKVCEFDISFGKGINKTGEIVDAAVALALIEKSGAWFKYEGETIAQGRDALVEYLNEQNTELRDQLEHTVRKNFGLIKEG